VSLKKLNQLFPAFFAQFEVDCPASSKGQSGRAEDPCDSRRASRQAEHTVEEHEDRCGESLREVPRQHERQKRCDRKDREESKVATLKRPGSSRADVVGCDSVETESSIVVIHQSISRAAAGDNAQRAIHVRLDTRRVRTVSAAMDVESN